MRSGHRKHIASMSRRSEMLMSLRHCFISTSLLWLGLCCRLYIQEADAVEYIYVPADAVSVNSKTVLTLITQKVSWNEASAICKAKYAQQGGSLVKVDSAQMNKLLVDLTTAAGQNAWIGLHWKSSSQNVGQLYWSDPSCTTFDIGGYQQFAKGVDKYNKSKRCYILDQQSGQWTVDNCKGAQFFICQHLESSISNCATGSSSFDVVSAVFYNVPKNETNAQLCAADCSGTLGCFLAWSSNKMCLMGIIDSSGSTYVKSRCFETTIESSVEMYYQDTADEVPDDCDRIDVRNLSVKAIPITGYTPLRGHCGGDATIRDVDHTNVASRTATYAQMRTTTVTSVQIVTTTDVRTTTTTIARIFPTMSTGQIVATPTYQTACTETYTYTIAVLTTASGVSWDIQPTTSPYASYLKSQMQPSKVRYPCQSPTATTDTINYATSTFANCPVTSCHAPETSRSQSHNVDGIVTTTVTETDCTFTTPSGVIVKTMERTTYDQPIIRTTTVVSIVPATVVAAVTNCVLTVATPRLKIPQTLETTLYGQPISKAITVLNIVPTTIADAVTDCTVTTTIANWVTKTEIMLSMPSCDIVTQTPISDWVMTSTTFVTQTVTPILPVNTLQIDTNTALLRQDINGTYNEQEINRLLNSIVEDLTVPTANLSRTRRRKESAEDNRLTARIPGAFACVVLCFMFGMLVLLDVPALVKNLQTNVQNKFEV